MASRRAFIKGVTLLGISNDWMRTIDQLSKNIHAVDGIDWASIRALFPIANWDKIQFNSGSAGVMPIPVRDNLLGLIEYVNSKAPYHVWGEWQKTKQNTLSRLSEMTGCLPEELQIVRNTTEALNMIIYGLYFKPGDEVIIASHDYPFARNAWLNRSNRDGVILKEANVVLPASDEEVVKAYEAQITEKTKAIHITYITHREGHIMPVEAVTELAHKSGIEVIVDGAHVIGQIGVDLKKIDCDYFGSSLHKWLSAPLGTGLLFVKKDKIDQLYNHPSSNLDVRDKMDKYEHIGTRAWANEIGISAALDFHEMIGQKAKTDRLQHLKEYWMNKVYDIEGVHMHTYMDSTHSAAVSTFSIDGFSGGQIRNIMNDEYDIHIKSVGGAWGSGIRVSPNIFTDYNDLDRLVGAISDISKRS